MKIESWDIDFTDYPWRRLDTETYADTFIEWCFEQKSYELNQGKKLLNEWRARKEIYISRLKTIVFDFQHFSRHDSTHSVNILNSIELVLGRNRVKKLSCSDLWLLLESAYFHDIGMALSAEERKKILSDSDFKDFVNSALMGSEIDEKEASTYLKQAENLLNNKEQLHGLDTDTKMEFNDSWSMDVAKKANILIASYIRRSHPKRSRLFMESMSNNENDDIKYDKNESIIKERLNNLVAQISELHGKNFKDIYTSTVYQDLGFDTEYLHPQFAAAMLRLGDLLDMDNNRFNVRAIEHFGDLPILSSYHYEKHKAIYHYSISSQQIEALAISDKGNVCHEVSKWFRWLKEEVENLICDWNTIVPSALKGCTLCRCKLEVRHGDAKYYSEVHDSFQVDQDRVISLLIGSNIYESKLDCFREYIQNAMDASKMHLWLDISNKGIDLTEPLSEITPFDIDARYYNDRSITIDISVSAKNVGQDICIKIIDHGVGMESDCINGLSVVGRGWKKRKIYTDEIPKMPEWLKPTGGFGIGLQSAFMITDRVSISTKSIKEADGYKIYLDSPKKGGGIIKSQIPLYSTGTTVEIHVPQNTFFDLVKNVKKLELSAHENLNLEFRLPNNDPFSNAYTEDFVFNYFKYYLKKQIPNPLFPIKIICRDIEYIYKSPYASFHGGFGSMKLSNRCKDCIYSISDDFTVRIWDTKENNFISIFSWAGRIDGFDYEMGKLLNHFCYRGVKVNHINEKELDIHYYNFLSVCIDIMGKKMDKILSLNRNDFVTEFIVSKYYKEYLALYVEIIFEKVKENNLLAIVGDYLNVYLYLLLAIQVMKQDKLSEILDFFEKGVVNSKQRIILFKNNQLNNTYLQTKHVLKRIAKIFTNSNNKQKFNGKIIIVAQKPYPPLNQISCISLDNEPQDSKMMEIYKLLKEDHEWIYADDEICKVLNRFNKNFDTYSFRIANDNMDQIYTMISGLNENRDFENQIKIKEEDFLKKAFNECKKGRYIAKNIDYPEYRDLIVSCLPNTKEHEEFRTRKKTYLISPISKKVYMHILTKMGIDICEQNGDTKPMSKKLMSEEQFIEIVTKENDFSFLVSWVYQNRITNVKKSMKLCDVEKLYKEMLSKIYKFNFNQETFERT